MYVLSELLSNTKASWTSDDYVSKKKLPGLKNKGHQTFDCFIFLTVEMAVRRSPQTHVADTFS